MSTAYTPTVGLSLFGKTGWRQDGTDGEKIDINMSAVDSWATGMQEQVNQISISGLPPIIDCGTF